MSLDYTSSDNDKIGDYLIQELYDTDPDSFSEIMTGIHLPTKEKVSIKIINKEKLVKKEQKKRSLLTEILLLKKMKHRNVIKLYEIIKTHEKIYLIMEYCNSGNIYDTIDNRGPRPEKQACLLFQQILDLLLYLKSQKIFQVNINPENILLDINNKNITCKLKNFQKSKKNYKNNENNSMIYNAGVLLYYMVCGYFPFNEEGSEDDSENSSLDIQEDLSHPLCDLLKHLLNNNSKKAYSLEQITNHPWFNIIKYIPKPGVIMGKQKIPVDYQIVKQCESFGYDKWKIIESVEKNNYDKYSAVYYILLKKLEREGVGSISDLYSEKYLEYMNIINDFLNKNENNDKDEKDNDSDNDDNKKNNKNNKKNKKSYSKTEKKLKNKNRGAYSDSEDSESSDESESDDKNKNRKKGENGSTKRKIIKILNKSKNEKENENNKNNSNEKDKENLSNNKEDTNEDKELIAQQSEVFIYSKENKEKNKDNNESKELEETWRNDSDTEKESTSSVWHELENLNEKYLHTAEEINVMQYVNKSQKEKDKNNNSTIIPLNKFFDNLKLKELLKNEAIKVEDNNKYNEQITPYKNIDKRYKIQKPVININLRLIKSDGKKNKYSKKIKKNNDFEEENLFTKYNIERKQLKIKNPSTTKKENLKDISKDKNKIKNKEQINEKEKEKINDKDKVKEKESINVPNVVDENLKITKKNFLPNKIRINMNSLRSNIKTNLKEYNNNVNKKSLTNRKFEIRNNIKKLNHSSVHFNINDKQPSSNLESLLSKRSIKKEQQIKLNRNNILLKTINNEEKISKGNLFKNYLILNKNRNKKEKIKEMNKSVEMERDLGHKKLNKSVDIAPQEDNKPSYFDKKIKNYQMNKKNIYDGPLDIKNLFIEDSLKNFDEKIINSLKKNKIKFYKINQFKYSCCCKESMDKFELEVSLIPKKVYEYDDCIRKNEDDIDMDDEYEFHKDNNSFSIDYFLKNENPKLLYIKLLSKDNNDIQNIKLLQNIINSMKKEEEKK